MIDCHPDDVEGNHNPYFDEDRAHRRKIALRYFEMLVTSLYVRVPAVAADDPRTFDHYAITVIRPDQLLAHPLIVAGNSCWSSQILRLPNGCSVTSQDLAFEGGRIALPIWPYMAFGAVDQIVSLVRSALFHGRGNFDRGYEDLLWV